MRKLWWLFSLIPLVIPILTQDGYYLGLLINIFIYIVLTLSFMLLMQVGLLSLGQCAFYAIGAYLCTLFVMKGGLSYWVALPLSAFATMAMTALIFAPILRTRGLFFAIMTLCTSVIVAEVAGNWESMLGGHTGISGIPKPSPIGPIDFTSRVGFYFLALAIMYFTIIITARLGKSHFGITLRLIRNNEILSRHIGINPFKYKLMVVSISSFFAALMGGFYAPYSKYIYPGISSIWDSLYVQIYGITGGLNYLVSGAIVGTVILKILPELMRVTQMYQPMFFGLILIIVVLFLPHGLTSLPWVIKRWWTTRAPALSSEQKGDSDFHRS